MDYQALEKISICKEALGALFGIGPNKLTTLIKHAVHHTLPMHGSTGTISQVTANFRGNVVPPLASFSKNQIILMTGSRPTQHTHYAVSQTVIERDTNGIMEFDQ